MQIIFKPEGPQQKYAESAAGMNDGLVCNLYTACNIGCKFCKPPEKFMKEVISNNVLKNIDTQCKTMQGDKRPILLCFNCDPYQDISETINITTQALRIFEKYKMNIQIMTKGGMRAANDFGIIKRNNWAFGTSISFSNDNDRKYWEPKAASINSRYEAIYQAHALGVKQWISVEPIIDPDQAITLVSNFRDIVDYWKFATLHGQTDPKDIIPVNWNDFFSRLKPLLKGKNYLLRPSLAGKEK